MVARVVHQDHEIVAVRAKRLLHATEQPQVGRHLPQRLDEPHHGEPLHAIEHDGARRFEVRAAECLDRGGREAAFERLYDGGGVRVPRRLARRDIDARGAAHGRVVAKGARGAVVAADAAAASPARGEACTAAATRNPRASASAPAAPDTTHSSSPRPARRKLSSSSWSGSASGASRRTCSTIWASVVAPRSCQPGFRRKKSPLPCARSSEQYPVRWKMRSLRVRSRDTRLAVTFAIAPLANSRRGVASYPR